jgi:hypothetical protein
MALNKLTNAANQKHHPTFAVFRTEGLSARSV